MSVWCCVCVCVCVHACLFCIDLVRMGITCFCYAGGQVRVQFVRKHENENI